LQKTSSPTFRFNRPDDKINYNAVKVTLKSALKFETSKQELNYFQFSDIQHFKKNLGQTENLVDLKLNNCSIDSWDGEVLPPINTLKSITFNKCNDNIFKIFAKQEAVEKITVNDWTWNGFPHDVFNEICENCSNLNHLVLIGAGTGSYFDNEKFPFRITKLETSMITFHWYIGIQNERVSFLKSQKGKLRELRIEELPYDFDGGKVLKYIIEEMNLETFYYGKIPLILGGQKQQVKEFTASELQITSAYEMFRQFPLVEKFTLKLSNTDISSDAIEKIINLPTDLFNNLKEFEVIDNSSYRGIFGVFLELYRNLENLKKLTFRTQDRNINTILECLSIMPNLEEIQLTSTAPRALERYKTILKLAPNLKKMNIPKSCVDEAQGYVRGRIEIVALDDDDAPGGFNEPPEDEGNEPRDMRGDDDDEDDEPDDEPDDDDDDDSHGIIEEKYGDFLVHSGKQ